MQLDLAIRPDLSGRVTVLPQRAITAHGGAVAVGLHAVAAQRAARKTSMKQWIDTAMDSFLPVLTRVRR